MKMNLTPTQPKSEKINIVPHHKIVSPPATLHQENTSSQYSSLSNTISLLSHNMNEKFHQMMNFIQDNITPKQPNENTKNISIIQEQLRAIHQRLDKINSNKNSLEIESENDDSNFATDNEMDDRSQDTNQSFEQTDIKRRKIITCLGMNFCH